jgi:large subunit ribosomal protein L29
MLKVEDLRGLSEEELLEKAGTLKKELMQFRFQSKTGKLEQQSVLKRVRRDIARVLTIANEKLAENRAQAAPAPARHNEGGQVRQKEAVPARKTEARLKPKAVKAISKPEAAKSKKEGTQVRHSEVGQAAEKSGKKTKEAKK